MLAQLSGTSGYCLRVTVRRLQQFHFLLRSLGRSYRFMYFFLGAELSLYLQEPKLTPDDSTLGNIMMTIILNMLHIIVRNEPKLILHNRVIVH